MLQVITVYLTDYKNFLVNRSISFVYIIDNILKINNDKTNYFRKKIYI